MSRQVSKMDFVRFCPSDPFQSRNLVVDERRPDWCPFQLAAQDRCLQSNTGRMLIFVDLQSMFIMVINDGTIDFSERLRRMMSISPAEDMPLVPHDVIVKSQMHRAVCSFEG